MRVIQDNNTENFQKFSLSSEKITFDETITVLIFLNEFKSPSNVTRKTRWTF